MKFFHAQYWDGALCNAQIIHSETGVSIIDDLFKFRQYIKAQYMEGKAEGPIRGDIFQQGLEKKLGFFKKKTLVDKPPVNKRTDSCGTTAGYGENITYTVRNIKTPNSVDEALSTIANFCKEQMIPMILTVNDESWLHELQRLFPEYKLNQSRLKNVN